MSAVDHTHESPVLTGFPREIHGGHGHEHEEHGHGLDADHGHHHDSDNYSHGDHDHVHTDASMHDKSHQHTMPSATQWLAKAALFLGMGAYFLYLWLGGNLGNYINARFMWLSVLAAGLFLLLAAACLSAYFRARRHGLAVAYGYHDLLGHTHPRISLPIFAVLAAPLVLGTLIPSRPLGADAVGGELMPTAPTENMLVASANAREWTVVDWLRVFYYSGNPDRLNGREADVVGFVYRRNGDPKGHFMVARFMMSCCSADSYAIGLPVAWDGADQLPTDTWVRVRGPVRIGEFGKNSMPIIEATSVDDTIGKPAQPYLYP